MQSTALRCLLAALMLGGSFGVAEAASIYGRWRSSSGNEFHITPSGSRLHLTVAFTNGAVKALSGRWVRGMGRTQFVYWDGSGSYTGTFSASDPGRIRVVSPSGAVTWWRRAHAHAPGRSRIFGTWRSTTGNLFQVPAAGRRRFDLIVTHTDGRREVFMAHWVRGMRGSQFEYTTRGVRYTGTFSPTDPNRIRNTNSSGGVSWWTRYYGGVPQPPPRAYRRRFHPANSYRRAPLPMDSQAFGDLHRRVRSKSFSRDKIAVISLAANHNWFSCSQVSQLLRSMSFGRDKLSALRTLAPRIIDKSSAYSILDAFTFSRDKQQARAILSI